MILTIAVAAVGAVEAMVIENESDRDGGSSIDNASDSDSGS